MGLCSGLVLGFLAAIMAVHFISNRRSSIPFSPKASGTFGTGGAYHSPPGVFQGESRDQLLPMMGSHPTLLLPMTLYYHWHVVTLSFLLRGILHVLNTYSVCQPLKGFCHCPT